MIAIKVTAMIILSADGRTKTYHRCPCRKCFASVDAVIPEFYSPVHAIHSGWIYTSDPKYKDPSTEGIAVWVCPDSYRKGLQ